jgi:hypothetical protein
MNTSLLTGFVIGGMLMIALMTYSNRVSQNAGLVAMNQITKQRVEAIAQIAGSDFQKIGQGIGVNQILAVTPNSIEFRTTFNTTTSNVVKWEFLPDEEIPETPNPDDRVLRRIVNTDTTTINFGVTRFDLTFFNETGAETFIPDQIRRIRVEVMCESDQRFGNEIAKSFWEQDFSPRAIQN